MKPTPTFGSIVIASNRGPVSYSLEDGDLVPSRGSGGVVTALTGALRAGGTWIAAAMSDGDREMAARDPLGRIPADDAPYSLRYLTLSAEDFDGYYNYVSNGILWFANHYLWDNVHTPNWNERTEAAWECYRRVNAAFADALADEASRLPQPTAFLVQDYHLSLVPAMLRERHPEALISHFTHTPVAGPTYVRALPTQMRRELLRGLLGADVLGFHSEAWAENFLMSARYIPGARVELSRYRAMVDGHETLARVHPLSIDAAAIRQTAAQPQVAEMRRAIEEWRGDAKLILRVDRFELSKNILRGFTAYELFLRTNPQWRGRVRFLALLSPSRTEVPEYRTYADECLAEAERVNDALGTPDWQPIEVRVKDDYDLAVAAYGLYDVLMVNPVIDGLNLVSMEGPVVNRRHGVLLLSRNAGAYYRLGRYAVGINPHDIAEQANAIAEALDMPDDERITRARGLSRLVRSNPPSRWVAHQLRDLDKVRTRRAWYQSS
jgi:trehalose 6-phosphate synthase